jgi:hypothetical protein
MANDITKPPTEPKDNFGWEPDINLTDGDENDRPARSMQGETKLSFNDPDWSANKEKCNGRELIVWDKTYSIVRWKDDGTGPLVVIPVVRGAPLPDVKEMNAKIPQEEWRIAFGKPEPPYQLQRCLEFLDPVTMERLSWPHNVKVFGSSRAADELEMRINTVRRLRGLNVYPLVKLENTYMPTQHSPRGKQRPYLRIIKWGRLTEQGIEYIDISAPVQAKLEHFAEAGSAKAAQQSVLPKQSAPDVPLSEEMDDTIPWK